MKGLFYKESNGDKFKIISEPIAVREDGADTVCVVVCRVRDGYININEVTRIGNVYVDKP